MICFALLMFSLSLSAQQPDRFDLWPNGIPESNGLEGKEKGTFETKFQMVTHPEIYVYHPAKDKNNGRAVVICPGGGYGGLAFTHEGTDVAKWLAENGTTGIVLKYRMPNGHHEIPLKDAHKAITTVREKASGWGIDPKKVGIMGFSAGGHLASTASTHYDEKTRPDFSILFYAVITFDEAFTHFGSRYNLLGKEAKYELVDSYCNERQITKDTPPALLFHSDDDTAVPVRNSVEYYMGLKRNNVQGAMYIFPEGKHGFGFNKDFRYHNDVKRLMLEWMDRLLK